MGIFYSHSKSEAYLTRNAKLIQYNTVAAILLPGGKILSENEANLKMSRDGKSKTSLQILVLGSSNAQRLYLILDLSVM